MIGIVGGVGPAAGTDLVKKIIEETVAGSDQEHLPVLLYSLPGRIADRTDYLEGKAPVNPGLAMAAICRQMEQAGVTVAGIPCNTAHAPEIFDTIREELEARSSTLQLVHLVDETVRSLRTTFGSGTNIGILSTTGTYKRRLYADKLAEAGFACTVPSEAVQTALVHNAVYHPVYGIKAGGGKGIESARRQLRQAMDGMQLQGAEAVLLACTEMPLALPEATYRGMPLIDATRVLARALIRMYDPAKLKPEARLARSMASVQQGAGP